MTLFRGPMEVVGGVLYGIVCGVICWYLPDKKHVGSFATYFCYTN